MDKIKPEHIHEIIKQLSPKKTVLSKKLGKREIPRSVTKEGVELATKHFNDMLSKFIECCESALREINNNPNSYKRQFRYDEHVIQLAIEIMEKRYPQ